MINQRCLAIAQIYKATFIGIVQESIRGRIGGLVRGVDTVNAKWVLLHNFRSAASVAQVKWQL